MVTNGSAAAERIVGTWRHVGSRALRASVRFSRREPVGAICIVFLVALGAVAALAPVLAPYDPLVADYANKEAPPSSKYLMGTDRLGRDLLSRLIYGAQITLLVAFVSVVIGDAIGFVWGVASGYLGGKGDLISQRVVDVLMSFPSIILALLLLAVLGRGLTPVIIAIAVTRVPDSTRVVRSVAIASKEMAYVDAARAMGASPVRIMVRHIAPQCIAPLLVILSVSLGGAVFAEAALSFLGLGIPPPNPSWGSMLSGLILLTFNPPWWQMVFPGVAITLTVLAFNLLGDTLRDVLDPQLRGTL
jgi:ABC-type dipeptide/oligopeptide/nickel transport system permease subunit